MVELKKYFHGISNTSIRNGLRVCHIGCKDLDHVRSIKEKEYLFLLHMKWIFKSLACISGYGSVLNQYTVLSLEAISQVTTCGCGKFIRSVVSRYGKHPIYTDYGT